MCKTEIFHTANLYCNMMGFISEHKLCIDSIVMKSLFLLVNVYVPVVKLRGVCF